MGRRLTGKINDRAAGSVFRNEANPVLDDMKSSASNWVSDTKRGMEISGMLGPDKAQAAQKSYDALHAKSDMDIPDPARMPGYDQGSDMDIPGGYVNPEEVLSGKTSGKPGFFDSLVKITPSFVKDHPWAASLGTVATVAALVAAYAYWKKKKGQENSIVAEMCVLYPLIGKYTKSLNESYSLSNYNSYINATNRFNKIAPIVYDMMLREADYIDTWNSKSGYGYDKVGGDPMPVPHNKIYTDNMPVPHNKIYTDNMPVPHDKIYTDTMPVPHPMVGSRSDMDIPDPVRIPGYDQGSDMDIPGGYVNPEESKGRIAKILEYFKNSGDKSIAAFLNGFNVSMEWVKAHPGIAGAGALITILGAYGTYKLIQIYKEKKETGEVDVEKIAESLNMLTKLRSVCESSCNPYISETQKYKNITLICNLIDSDL